MKKNRPAAVFDVTDMIKAYSNLDMWTVDGQKVIEMSFSIIMTFLEGEGQYDIDECIKKECDQRLTNPIEINGWVEDIHWHSYRLLYDYLFITQQYLFELLSYMELKDWVKSRLTIDGWLGGTTLVVSYDKP